MLSFQAGHKKWWTFWWRKRWYFKRIAIIRDFPVKTLSLLWWFLVFLFSSVQLKWPRDWVMLCGWFGSKNLGGEGGEKTTPEGWMFLTFSTSFCDQQLWTLWEKAKVVITTVFFCDLWFFHSVVRRIPCDQGASRNMLWTNRLVKIKQNCRGCLLLRPGVIQEIHY